MISVYTYTFLQYTFDWTKKKFNYVIFIVYIICGGLQRDIYYLFLWYLICVF